MSKVLLRDANGNVLTDANGHPYAVEMLGSEVFVNGVKQDVVEFTSDPQEQITANTDNLTTLAGQVNTNANKINKRSIHNIYDYNGVINFPLNYGATRHTLSFASSQSVKLKCVISGSEVIKQYDDIIKIDIYTIWNEMYVIGFSTNLSPVFEHITNLSSCSTQDLTQYGILEEELSD